MFQWNFEYDASGYAYSVILPYFCFRISESTIEENISTRSHLERSLSGPIEKNNDFVEISLQIFNLEQNRKLFSDLIESSQEYLQKQQNLRIVWYIMYCLLTDVLCEDGRCIKEAFIALSEVFDIFGCISKEWVF